MTGNDLREDLKAYLDGELTAERAAEVESLIAEDVALQQEVEFMRLLTKSLSTLESERVGRQSQAEALASRLTRRRMPWILKPWVLAGVAGAVLLIAFLPRVSMQERVRFAPAADTTVESQAPAASPASGSVSGRELSSRSDAPKSESAAPSDFGAAPDVSVPDALRQVIKTGSLEIIVDDVELARREVLKLVDGWGGYVKSSSSGQRGRQVPTLTMTVRVPVQNFDDAMIAFESLGVKVSSNSDSEDVTAELVDLDARLRTLRSQEETYRRLLGQAKTVGQVMEVEDRLSQIRAEIESLEGQRKTLSGLAKLSTLELTMVGRPKPGVPQDDPGFAGDAWTNAVRGLQSAWRAIATAAIFVFVWAPIWLPLAIVLYAYLRRARAA